MRNNHTTKKRETSTAASDGSSIDVRKKKSGAEVCSFSSVAAAITDEIFPIAVRQEENNSTEANNNNGTKQSKGQDNNHKSSSAKQNQQKKQPLFAAVIQNWFLEERMKARGVPLESKNSKKKKRKKKKGAQASTDDGGGDTANEGSAIISLDNGVTLSSTSQSAASPTSSRKLDCVLDKFIDLQIEGIDDYEPNVVEGRDLQAFTTFLGHKFECYLNEQQTSQADGNDKSMKSSLPWETDKLHSGTDFEEVLPTILMDDVNSNAQKAECACGQAIRSHLNTWADKYQSVKQTIVLEAKTEDEEDYILGHSNENEHGLSIPVCSNYLDADNDDPFAYGALIDDDFDIEAGAQSSEQTVEKIDDVSTLRLELRQISSPTDAVRYLQVDPVCTQNDEEKKFVYPIDEQSILDMVKCILVPSGIGEGEDVDYECALNEIDVHFIKDRAESSENEFLHQFFDMLRTSESAKTKLIEAREEQARRTIFDPKTSVGLRGADQELNALLKKIVQFLIRVTKYSCCVGWFSEKPTPISIVTQLWTEFEKLLVDLVKPALKVRGTEIQVNRRPGKVPQAFCNTAVRNSHDQLICLKIDKLDRLLYLLRSEFLRRPDCNSNNFLKTSIPSPMLRICVMEAYSMRKNKISADDMFSNEESLECLNEMLAAKIGLPQVNFHTTLRAVERSERDRAERFKLAYKKVVEIVTKADAHLTCQSSPDVADLVCGAEVYESKRLDYELEEKNPSESTSLLSLDYDDNPTNVNMEEDITRALNKSGALWMQWIYTLCMENYSVSPIKKFHINRELKVYMDGEIKNPCEGGGERKVSVIVATLIYRWLEAKYNEWHAELTREELLQEAMEVTTPQITTKGAASKKSKKKKPKKKKKVKEESTRTSQSISTNENSLSNVDGEDAKDAGIDSEIVATVTDEVEESVTSPILNGFNVNATFHSTSDVGWTTVGVNPTIGEDAKINEEINTARDEEIARALQEQFQEEAKEYEAENIDTPSTQESSVENSASIAQEEKNDEISDDIVTASAAKITDKAKTKKPSKSQKAKAKQTRIGDAKIAAARPDVTVNDDSATNGQCVKTGVEASQSQSEATAEKKPITTQAETKAKRGLTGSNDIKADKNKQVTAQRDEALTSNGVRADKKSALKSQNKADKKADKKKQVVTQAAANMKIEIELSTSDDAESDNVAASSNANANTNQKQKQFTPQAVAKQINENRPKIGVYDGDQFVDAETYLVSRVRAVQKKLVWL